jgi:GTPase SAR1 family protein
MDAATNPFTPGAGTPPPELAGREAILETASIAVRRLQAGRPSRSMFLLGLRGVGKTVLLNRVYHEADDRRLLTVKIEASESGDFARQIVPELNRILVRLSASAAIRKHLKLAGAALQNFASIFRVSYEGISFGAQPAGGIADTRDYATDLSEVIRTVLTAARAAGQQIAFFIDEVQYLREEELAALVVACHDAAQRQLPFLLVGAGLPQLAKLAGDAKSYSERLFEFPEVGPLDDVAARHAIAKPIHDEGVDITDEALAEICRSAHNYPYFLQEWGAHTWNEAEQTPISIGDVNAAGDKIVAHLDRSFFRVRFDRCKPVQQKYLRAMAELGPGPHKTGDIAAALGCEPPQVAATRAQLVSLGMIWSQRHGETAFTVPLFDEFMKRQMPQLEPHRPRKRPRKA